MHLLRLALALALALRCWPLYLLEGSRALLAAQRGGESPPRPAQGGCERLPARGASLRGACESPLSAWRESQSQRDGVTRALSYKVKSVDAQSPRGERRLFLAKIEIGPSKAFVAEVSESSLPSEIVPP